MWDSSTIEGNGKNLGRVEKGNEEKARPVSREPWPSIHTREGALLARVADPGRASDLLSFAALFLIVGRAAHSTRSPFCISRRFWRELTGANAASDLRRVACWKSFLQLAVQLVLKVLPVGLLTCHFFGGHSAISVLGPDCCDHRPLRLGEQGTNAEAPLGWVNGPVGHGRVVQAQRVSLQPARGNRSRHQATPDL